MMESRPRTAGPHRRPGRYVQALQNARRGHLRRPRGHRQDVPRGRLGRGLAARAGRCKKIVLVRPAVEAGERLGFLPGDLVAKISPYLRPLFDALNDIMDPDTVKKYMESDIIEILPLAYMRGRTLNNACIILDEGQNATTAQMKMFLTRMGMNSKIVVTGDMTQTDLPRTVRSGLADAVHRLRNVEGLAIVYLDQADIVRNPLVTRIVKAYEGDSPRPKKTTT